MENNKRPELVPTQKDYVSTDIVTDIKSGIYNLFVSLVDYMSIDHGPIEGAEQACKFLERLVDNVREAINTDSSEIKIDNYFKK